MAINRCLRCGTILANCWIGSCPNCGYINPPLPDFRESYGSVVEKMVDPPVSGSIVAATTAVSAISGAYFDAKIRLDSLRAIGAPEDHLKPLESDINKLYEDKMKAEGRLAKMYRWSSEEREKFAEDITKRLDKHAFAIRKDIKLVGIKVNGTTDLIRKLSEQVATKDDLKIVENLLVQNEEILIDALNERIGEFKKALAQHVEEKAGPKEASRFWQILEKISILGGTAEFAEYVKRLIDFLIENKILQTTLPVILKMVFG